MADRFIKPDGVWFEGPFVYLISQLKNESGPEGDPFLHSLTVYNKIVEQEEVSSPSSSGRSSFH